jgi:sulfatase modifying factor 1|tara:strand:- start:361 stop:1143 length:783 start_codon:yes stop_codon:yes gene_type:complete
MNVKKYAFLMFITIFFICSQKDVYGNALRDSVEMKTIPAGEFIMGSKMDEGRADERPQRKIYLDSYEIDSYEVSNNQYLNFIRSTGRKDPLNPYSEILLSDEAGVGNLPIVQVTWYDAVDYCRWAGKYLPSESQWEKAARGEKGLVFPWGSKKPSQELANYQKNWDGIQTLWPVSAKIESSSPYGVIGMAGNAREWVKDWYSPEYYKNAPSSNPQGPSVGILKVIKGGSWHSFKSDIRSASRGKGGFALKTDGIGFRCAK